MREDVAAVVRAVMDEEKPETAKAISASDFQIQFEQLAAMGPMAYKNPKLDDLVSRLRHTDQRAQLLTQGLRSEDSNGRFVAAALAEKLQATELLGELEAVASEDEAMIVRRMASHAMAAMPGDDKGAALARVLQGESEDNGVRLNAWAGLVSQNPQLANANFESLLDGAGGGISADAVVEVALTLGNADTDPSLVLALKHAAVSEAAKKRIITHLSKSSWAGAEQALAALLDQATLSPALKAAIEAALGR